MRLAYKYYHQMISYLIYITEMEQAELNLKGQDFFFSSLIFGISSYYSYFSYINLYYVFNNLIKNSY